MMQRLPLRMRANGIGSAVLAVVVDAAMAAAAIPQAGASSTGPLDPPTASTGESSAHDARMRWWREARFGMFIHWGLYSEAAGRWNGQPIPGVGEWILTHARIPIEEYELLRDRFNPVDFDARQWVAIARRAGMKYIVITSKHHDGFCLWPSALTEWDIASTPFGRGGRDPLGELYRACEAEGIRLGLYYSIMDWHHPDYLPRREWDTRPPDGADFDRFRATLRGQLVELIERYPNLGVLWFDGEWEHTWTSDHGREIFDWLRSIAPSLIINNRLDKGRDGMAGLTRGRDDRGDFGTPEQEIPEQAPPEGIDWESCMTMNDSWGFKADDHRWKSTETLIRMLVDAASKGGNFLLNVGPDGRGRIPPESVERLQAIGRWLQPRGEAIYGTRASPFGTLPWGRVTRRELDDGRARLYLFIFDRPRDGRLRLPGLATGAGGAFVLGAERRVPLEVERDEDAVVVRLPDAWLEGPVPVIALDLNGQAIVVAPPSISARSSTFVDSTLVELGGAGHGRSIRYTLDGSEPDAMSSEAHGPVRLERSCTLSARIFEGDRPLSATASRVFRRVVPRRAVERPTGPTSGLRVTIYERDRFERLADIDGAVIRGSLIVPSLSLDRRMRDEHFAMVFEGFLRVPGDGVWRFRLESDDGARLQIGDQVVVDLDGLHEAQRREGEIALEAGLHPVRIEYFNATGRMTLSLEWDGPGTPSRPIPDSAFAWPL